MSAAKRADLELYLLRHADAGDPDAWTGDDAVRPLSDKGRQQSERLGRFLKEVGFTADAVVSSPKARALQTAELVAKPIGLTVMTDERMAVDVGLAAVEAALDAAGSPRRAVLVGHDPDFSELVEVLCGTSSVPMKKGALARIDAEQPLVPGRGTLRWLVPPDLLKGSR